MPPKKEKATSSKSKTVNVHSDDEQSEASPLKKLKKGKETFDEFMSRIQAQRQSAGASVEVFKFDKTRCRTLTKVENLPTSHQGVLYWMSRDQRVQDNWALLYAQRLALKEKVPLIVCFCLVPKFLQATLRQYAFMLRGLKLVREELHDLKIPFHLLFGEAKNLIPEFVQKHNIGGVVTDFSPLRVPKAWTDEMIKKLPESVPLCQVDAHNVVPVWVTSDKLEYAARTIRPKIEKRMSTYLTEFPPVVKHPHQGSIEFSELKIENPFEKWDDLIKKLDIDKTIGEVEWAKPGSTEGFKTLQTFMDDKLRVFNSKRNDPNEQKLSNLSPWFHFGQISVARCIIEVKKCSHSEGIAAFVEEAVIRRELSDNFCFYNDKYDSLEGANDWARKTLNDHRGDKRKPLYTKETLETAKTYDDLWNAAQNQMRIEGKMHGYIRMYWAKKILEWTESPEQALEIAIYLNDKYNLDGRDPNGFVGCMWSICGIHDQGWRERAIFGKIRYMNYEGCKRKFDVKQYEYKFKKMAKDKGL